MLIKGLFLPCQVSARLAFVALLLCYGLGGQEIRPLDEITLGLQYRQAILSSNTVAPSSPASAVASDVLARLLLTPTAGGGPKLPYRLTVLSGDTVNAFITAGGQIYVWEGLADILGNSSGMWAAVLGHEAGHALLQHHYKHYLRAYQVQLQRAYYQAKAAQGDTGAKWSLLGLEVSAAFLYPKLSRNEEHEADRLGLMVMAEAGYHPDFTGACFRELRRQTGDSSKLVAFFSDHPRWETRIQRTEKAYEDAIGLFQNHWPSADSSPGGTPPPVAWFGEVATSKDNKSKTAIIKFPLALSNVNGRAVSIAVYFMQNGHPVPALQPEFSTREGHLIAQYAFNTSTTGEAVQVSFRVPTRALGTSRMQTTATAMVVIDGNIVEISKPFKVSFPKP